MNRFSTYSFNWGSSLEDDYFDKEHIKPKLATIYVHFFLFPKPHQAVGDFQGLRLVFKIYETLKLSSPTNLEWNFGIKETTLEVESNIRNNELELMWHDILAKCYQPQLKKINPVRWETKPQARVQSSAHK